MRDRLRQYWRENRTDPVFWFTVMVGIVAIWLIAMFPTMIKIAFNEQYRHSYSTCLPSKLHGHICAEK